MITAFSHTEKHVVKHELTPGQALPTDTVWIDINGATPEEIHYIQNFTRVHLPSLQDVRLLEQSQQAYVEKGVTYLLAPAVIDSHSDNPRISVILFALSQHFLITVHQARSRALENLAHSTHKRPEAVDTPECALMSALEAVVARCADLTEIIAHDMDRLGLQVFQSTMQDGKDGRPSWQRVLQSLGRATRLNHKLRGTLTGIDRLMAFLIAPSRPITEDGRARIKIIDRDLDELIRHVDFLGSESSFLLDAIVGSISIEQNNVMKLFSIAAVCLMPPTLIAGVFGMNFHYMPELSKWWGYPMALILMVLSALGPFIFFKRRGWF